MKKTIALCIFLLAGQLGHASLEIEERKMESSSHHGFIREIVTDLAEQITDDQYPVTINMATYRQLLKKEIESRRHFENASFLHRMTRFYEGDLRQCEYELKRKDFVIAKAIDGFIRSEKKMVDACAHAMTERLKFHEEFGQKQKPEHIQCAELAQLQASISDTEDKILMAKQKTERYFYGLYDQMMDEREAR